jgi:tetratricopeptide (TPR) repeat protein
MAKRGEGTQPWLIVLVTALIAAVPPITAQVYGNSSKDKETALAQQKENQDMRMAFLDRAIDPKYPLESRFEVLRFLQSVSSDKEMKAWADVELRSVQNGLDLKKDLANLQQVIAQKDKEASELKAQIADQAKSTDKATKLALEGKLAAAKDAQKQAEAQLAKTRSQSPTLAGIEEADNLSALSNSYYKSREYSRAEAMLRRTLELQQKKFGSDHPAVADSLYNLGTLYLATGDLNRAEEMFRHALTVRMRALGSSDPGNAKVLTGLASVLEANGKVEEARVLRMRADEIYRAAR